MLLSLRRCLIASSAIVTLPCHLLCVTSLRITDPLVLSFVPLLSLERQRCPLAATAIAYKHSSGCVVSSFF
ncbi:hypothetical protein BGW80DRAFT_1341647 [Lactifluus volemus]|nr:hypothetical protein BGW80DRAFT_1341647 [Lactifluus volemus]